MLLKDSWHTAKLPVTPFRFAPAGLCIFKVSHESQMHIAVWSGLRIKKVGSHDPREDALGINNPGLVPSETLAGQENILSPRDPISHF